MCYLHYYCKTMLSNQPCPLCLKLVRVMLETSHLVHKYTAIFSLRRYTFLRLALFNFPAVSTFLQKISVFC